MYNSKHCEIIVCNFFSLNCCHFSFVQLATRDPLKASSHRKPACQPGNLKVRQIQNLVKCPPFYIFITSGSSYCRLSHIKKLWQNCHKTQKLRGENLNMAKVLKILIASTDVFPAQYNRHVNSV